jgi:hypothetical protein
VEVCRWSELSLAQLLRLARQKRPGRERERGRDRERARASARVPHGDTVLSTTTDPFKDTEQKAQENLGPHVSDEGRYGQRELRFGTLRGVAFCRRASPSRPHPGRYMGEPTVGPTSNHGPAGPRVSEAHAWSRPVRKAEKRGSRVPRGRFPARDAQVSILI